MSRTARIAVLLTASFTLLSSPAIAATIPATTQNGDFTFITTEDVIQSGPLRIGGSTNISGKNITLTDTGNNFNSLNAQNQFIATEGLSIVDNSGLRGSFRAGNNTMVQSASTLTIDALNVTGTARLFASVGGVNFSDVVILNAQTLFVSGTLEIAAESIRFDFSDGGPADLSRLNVGALSLTTIPNPGGVQDTTVFADGVVLTSSGTPAQVPLPASLSLALASLAVLAGTRFSATTSMKRRRNASRSSTPSVLPF